ncbi:GAF domain-containing protein [Falsiruegeria mediterranea]|uniref:Adenylate cyclase 2 n=1 Tax=Falsiruegeria mediterranea M17 TaxID=1200281 RepID=A0A2R8CDI5_9RHOB|nr:GAF domain-containing protein [Falsiruegeria mediterranea]SPJ30461.1 Adenylate cyclase 2 [Falsiruegeria mediterranea M17]
MENDTTRDSLLTELHRGLRREEATRTILQVIQKSRDDEGPVFEAILTQAAVLCEASQASLQLANTERTQFEIAAYWGFEETAFNVGGTAPLDSGRPIPEAIRSGLTVNIADLSETDFYRKKDPIISHVVDVEGVRSWLVVPLLSGPQAIGAIALSRKEVRPFIETEIHLVESFAAQAVIAIENGRQFREVRTRLEREQASAEILKIISQSRDNEQPVLDAIVSNAGHLTNAHLAGISLVNSEGTHLAYAAAFGPMSEHFPKGTEFDLTGQLQIAVTVRESRTIQTPDMANDPLYFEGDPVRRKIVDEVGIRTFLTIPLVKNAIAFGCLNLSRREVRPFTTDEIRMVETFAAQAVIAIENVRQFRALETLNAELEDRVKDQVGEIERMGKLKRFLPAAVADTVISSGSEKMLASHRALLGVLFCDIRGFTAFCEIAEPEETIEVLQTYHEEMGKLINAHGAGVDHRMGDGIMVLFNDPIPCSDPAGDAVRLAVAMRSRMDELAKHWKRMGFRLGFGVGVSLGYATVGMVGYEGRSEYTASGTAINVASRLCELAEDGEILLSTRAAVAVEDDCPSISSGEFTLKGIREPIEVFRLDRRENS